MTFSVRKEEKKFDAETADVAMAYALADTEWSVGTVNVTSKRTWTSTEKMLFHSSQYCNLHGGDLVFDCPNRLVHLLTVNGKDSGALFAYKKNMKSIERVVDTRSLVTRLYAVGANGMTFADINNGKAYLRISLIPKISASLHWIVLLYQSVSDERIHCHASCRIL